MLSPIDDDADFALQMRFERLGVLIEHLNTVVHQDDGFDKQFLSSLAAFLVREWMDAAEEQRYLGENKNSEASHV